MKHSFVKAIHDKPRDSWPWPLDNIFSEKHERP